MKATRKWQVGLVCVVLMALLTPTAMALDVCGQGSSFIISEPDPVDIDCETGTILVSDSTVNLLPGGHISDALGGAPGSGNLTVDASVSNTINIYGGTIDTSLNTTSLDIVTIYGSQFVLDGVPVPTTQTQIVGPLGVYPDSPVLLTGVDENGDAMSIPLALENGAVLNLSITQTAPDIEVLPALLAWDLGDVELGQSTTMMVQIFNHGNADLTVSSVTLTGDASYEITAGPATPLVIAPSTNIGFDFEVTFAPTAEGTATATVQIVSDDVDESLVEVALTGVGIITVIPPLQQIQDILDYFDASVDDGTLVGYGPGNSASKRLKALRNMIKSASDLINAGAYEQAINQLESISKKIDGVSKPQDFAVGDAVAELNAMIEALIADLSA